MSLERITFDGDHTHMDEVVLLGVNIHIERMSQHNWWFALDRDGVRMDFNCTDLWTEDEDQFPELITVDPPLLGCGHEWGDFPHAHRCEVVHNVPQTTLRRRKHRCECGSRSTA